MASICPNASLTLICVSCSTYYVLTFRNNHPQLTLKYCNWDVANNKSYHCELYKIIKRTSTALCDNKIQFLQKARQEMIRRVDISCL